DQHVAVAHVSELVREHAIELFLVEDAQQPIVDAYRGVGRVAPGGKGVGRRVWAHVDAGPRYSVLHCETVGQAEEHRRLGGRYLTRLRRREGNPIAEPVRRAVHHDGKEQPDVDAGRPDADHLTDYLSDEHKEDGHCDKEEGGLDLIHAPDCSTTARTSITKGRAHTRPLATSYFLVRMQVPDT